MAKKRNILSNPATAALMKELGLDKKKSTTAVTKKVVRKRRGKPAKCPNIKTEIEKKKGFYAHIKKQWKILYGTNRRKAMDVPGWFRGFGVQIKGDDPELRSEMLALSNLARFILSKRDIIDE